MPPINPPSGSLGAGTSIRIDVFPLYASLSSVPKPLTLAPSAGSNDTKNASVRPTGKSVNTSGVEGYLATAISSENPRSQLTVAATSAIAASVKYDLNLNIFILCCFIIFQY